MYAPTGGGKNTALCPGGLLHTRCVKAQYMQNQIGNVTGMSIEHEIFMKRRPRFERFGQYGFSKIGTKYIYECDVMGGDFHCKIEIDADGKIAGTLIDTMTDEEYLPLRVATRGGAFVNTVRSEYEQILMNIANSCYAEVPFASHQANRITEQIYKKYNELPNFPWSGKAYKGSGTFRHSKTKKWFALIMNIKLSLLDATNTSPAMVDVVNVKIDSADGEKLRKEEGIYSSYHMNHKHWVSLILDDTLTDERVLELLDRSYVLTKNGATKKGLAT